ncbi:hypothetical protein NOC27_190 [Nitrosococcus oceani AFC27]|nr:hypothetical protein NOC27_190 [Nitrosococcus oceani AFC27]
MEFIGNPKRSLKRDSRGRLSRQQPFISLKN